jgi:hypothetical protein
MVSLRAANQKILNSLSNVIVPTVVGLVDQIATDKKAGSETELAQPETETEAKQETTPPTEETEPQPDAEASAPMDPERFLPQPPVNQFMVEKISGLLVAADTVRIDGGVISKWHELYGDRQITQVNIQTLDGKTATCKFKPIKEEKGNNTKGIIKIPEKILQSLQASKGKLVMVKPVIE